MSISFKALGAGQEVGRSCVIFKIKDVKIMFDCGVHMAFNDSRKFPDFSKIVNMKDTPTDKNIYKNLFNTGIDYTKEIDLIIISHFHLDHCGALPFFTEICKYNGPILMTQPTKSIFPITVEDFRRIISDYKGEKSIISNDDIQNCFHKITTIELNEEKIIKNRIKVSCYYAGHVLGAAMFHVEVDGFSAVYTGDYNTSVDRHLNGAFLPKKNYNVLITETTYGDTIRDTKRTREREFLKKIQSVIDRQGKVLIPIFALGRAQELCILLDTHWKRNNMSVPIYFYGAMSEKANFYYKTFNNWTNERVKSSFLDYNVFNFRFITNNATSKLNEDFKSKKKPMIILSTPGMLHGGMSLNIFKEICGDPLNCVIIPGYCTAGTIGNKILSGEKNVDIDNKSYQVNCEVYYMSFSAHADAKGLLQLIKQADPKNLVLVHGDVEVMKIFQKSVEAILSVGTSMPPNYEEVFFDTYIIYNQISLSFYGYKILKSIYEKTSLKLCLDNENNKLALPRFSNAHNCLKFGNRMFSPACTSLKIRNKIIVKSAKVIDDGIKTLFTRFLEVYFNSIYHSLRYVNCQEEILKIIISNEKEIEVSWLLDMFSKRDILKKELIFQIVRCFERFVANL